MKNLFFLLYLLFILAPGFTQENGPKIEMLTGGTLTSLRGLSVVDDRNIWVSGSNGMVGRSYDGGKTWQWQQVQGFETADFRDIEAFDGRTAVVMAVEAPATLLKTFNGGESWKIVYQNFTPGMFLDALEFWNRESGIVIGDPVHGKVFVGRTFDNGNTWMDIPHRYLPPADSGEAFFAASGTNVRPLDRDESVMVSGGLRSSIFIRDKKRTLPVVQGSASAGANSIAVWDNRKQRGGKIMVVVGGDFNRPQSDSLNCFYTTNRGKTWKAPQRPPAGYRSCVEFLSRKQVITCGPTGVDISADGGRTWQLVSREGFYVCRKAKRGTAVFLAGKDGRIGKVLGAAF